MSLNDLWGRRIVKVGRILYQRGLLVGGDGNISVKLSRDSILLTPSGLCKGRLKLEQIITVNMEGEVVSGYLRPSSEMHMHLHLYRKRPDIAAIVHSHPPFATSFAAAGQELAQKVLPEAVMFIGDIALTEYGATGTPEMARVLDPYIADHDAFLMKNHGLTVLGEDLDKALLRTETAEHFAHILYLARNLGGAENLPQDEINRLVELRKNSIPEKQKQE